MTGFQFEDTQKPGTNRTVRHNGCTTCDGHRMIQVSEEGAEAWARCPKCNPPSTEQRDPVKGSRWWEE